MIKKIIYRYSIIVLTISFLQLSFINNISASQDTIAELIHALSVQEKINNLSDLLKNKKANKTEHPLYSFFAALYNLETKSRKDPVRILHLGDSHIVADLFSGDLREFFQNRFANAGRGFLPPGIPDKYYQVRGAKISQSGGWLRQHIYKQKKLRYGITGVKFSSKSSKSK